MAAELQPSEKPAAGLTSGITTTAAVPDQAEAPPPAEDWPAPENAGPQPAPTKRQRRPSVRLRDIGDQQPAAIAHESQVRRPKWRLPKDSPYRKARSLTHLVNGNGDADFGPAHKKPKTTRGIGIVAGFGGGTAAKRVRSSWTSKPEETAEYKSRDWEGEEVEEEEEEVEGDRPGGNSSRDFTRSPDPSAEFDMGEPDSWQGRVNQAPESDNRHRRDEGVRSWLRELGLNRYAPIFEVHEVDDEVLPMLTLEDLKDMGINAVGSRRKMYSAILKLRSMGLS